MMEDGKVEVVGQLPELKPWPIRYPETLVKRKNEQHLNAIPKHCQ
jgi:hypothetical protein